MKKQWLIMLVLFATNLHAQEATDVNAVETTELAETNAVATTDTNAVATTEESATAETTEAEVSEASTNAAPVTAPVYVETVGYTLTNGDHLYASPKARFEVHGIDEQSGLKEILVSVDGSPYAPYKNPIGFSKEGEHTLSYQFIDRVGNVSYSKGFSVTLDATAPRVAELKFIPAPYYSAGMEYVGPNTEMTFSAYDDMTGVAFIEYAIKDQAMTRFESNTTLSNLGIVETGPVSISYQVTDMVSNVSPVKVSSIFLDATAPKVDVFSKAVDIDGVRYISTKDTISVEAYDDETKVSNVTYSINGSEYQRYDRQIGINIKTAGEYTILVKAMDMVGNESEPVEYKVNVDTLAPTGDVAYIGEARSEEPATTTDATATVETTEGEMATEEATTETVTEEVVTEEVTTTEEVETEVPAGSEVDAMEAVPAE